MGYSRNEQNTDQPGDFDASDATGRYGYGARPGDRSSARRYAAAGYYDQDRGQQNDMYRDRGYQGQGYQDRSYAGSSYASDHDRGYGERYRAPGSSWGDRSESRGSGYGPYGQRDDHAGYVAPGGYGQNYGRGTYGQSGNQQDYRSGGYGQSDRPRDDWVERSHGAASRQHHDDGSRSQGGRPIYDRDERGFVARAGDEVRSWFGDDEAARRRELDQRFDASDDHDYYSWRRSQIDALDRDYAEYRRENQAKFHGEFNNWRTERQGQRSSLSRVTEHMEVVGSDGAHVGTVDKVRGDRIILTKSDANADGKHHSIPSRWIETVDDKVTIRKTAQAAMDHWREEERASDDDSRSAFGFSGS